VLEWTYSA